ncbi:MAG TPA: 50S ribosomal protein L11 methyltransferase [Polyangia bacterium]|nr:50S ribosomal protein L11 methyltransferase [Polyangia bacterium]
MTAPARTWTELVIEVAAEASELVASEVSELTGGVEVRDAGTLLRAGEGRAAIVTQCAPEAADEVVALVEDVRARARAAGLRVDPVTVRRREAHEDEWRDVWKQFFRATRVGRTFVVRPSWDPGTLAHGDRVIDLDPGRAFGTGGHATTRLVIALAEEVAEVEARPVRRFLDLGCGSGILAIAAARLWPGARGLAVDVDPEATACAEENLARNHVATVETRAGTLADAPGPFDVVLANIQADILLPLAPELVRALAPGATVVLSGLLTDATPPVLAAYLAAGLSLEARRDEDEWTALRLSAPGPRG